MAESTPPEVTFPYIDISSVSLENGIGATETFEFSKAPSRARRIVKQGDVIVSTVRTYLKAISRVGPEHDGYIASTGFAVLSPKQSIDSDFLGWSVQAEGVVGAVVAHSEGVSYPAINASDLVKIKIELPPLPEQKAIAAFLDRETARIDALIDKKQRLIELLKEKRQALITRAVTRGLDPDVPLKDSAVEWLGQVPAHWKTGGLGKLCTKRCDGPFGSGLKSSHYVSKGVRVIRLQNIKECHFSDEDAAFISEEHYSTLGDHSVISGDILIAGLGDDNYPVGRACVAPSNISSAMVKADCYRFRPAPKVLNAEYGAYAITTAARAIGKALSSGSTRMRWNLGIASALILPVPPAEEQAFIARSIKSKLESIKLVQQSTHRSIKLLKERRAALITAAVTGQIDVREPSREAA